ncbi:GNAT family N-acetyltransferase [Furfurilactobacillus curtus]|uniref:Acetyltransferase n=1 Tax=Furfurilactobacillus curtus TaxID=1746200 RepID=A0ABQ5JVI2_9LACO
MALFGFGKRKKQQAAIDFEKQTGEEGKIYDDAKAVRNAVFVDEQGISQDLEFDGHDDQATHYVGYENDAPVVTARVTKLDKDILQIQRVATIDWARNKGYARALMDQITEDAKADGYRSLYLEAQETAVSFYAKQSFEVFGQPFLEANIWHRKMERELYPED